MAQGDGMEVYSVISVRYQTFLCLVFDAYRRNTFFNGFCCLLCQDS